MTEPIDLVLGKLAERGCKVRPEGGGWKCTCPAHDDRNPSLKVDRAKDGTVLVKCFGGCSVDGVLGALGLHRRDLFPPKGAEPEEFRSQAKPGKGGRDYTAWSARARERLTESFAAGGLEVLQDFEGALGRVGAGLLPRRNGYPPALSMPVYDPSGQVIGLKLRKLGKRPGLKSRSLGRGGMVGFPQLAERPDALVVICAGEKDLLIGLRLVPEWVWLSPSSGEGQGMSGFLAALHGREIAILFDRDDAGRKAGARLAPVLAREAKSVRLVELPVPGTPEAKDLADWAETLPAEDEGSALRDLVLGTPVWVASLATGTPDGDGGHGDEGDLSHDSLAVDLTVSWGDAKHVAPWGRWFFWTGKRWESDERLEHLTRTRRFLRERAAALLAEDPEAEGAARRIRSANVVSAVVGLARSNPDCAAGTEEWDADPFLLGTPEGTVDLRTGELREPRMEDRITKLTACAPAPPGTRSERWERFLARVTDGRASLVEYLQRLAGYCLTGSTREHVFAFCYGTGQNGKSVLLETVGAVLGEYAVTIPPEMLMASLSDRHPTELARLRGARLAIGSETEEGRQWAESRIKSLTGDKRLTARFMRQDFFEYTPQFKLLIAGNHAPSLRGVDKAIRRRLHFVPFDVTIPDAEVNKNLLAELEEDWPAILRWMIEGCLAWQRTGLAPPEEVLRATDKYLADEDAVLQWMDEVGTRDPRCFQSTGELWSSWQGWAKNVGEDVGKKRGFVNRIVRYGMEPARLGDGTRGYRGLRLFAAAGEEGGGDAW